MTNRKTLTRLLLSAGLGLSLSGHALVVGSQTTCMEALGAVTEEGKDPNNENVRKNLLKRDLRKALMKAHEINVKCEQESDCKDRSRFIRSYVDEETGKLSGKDVLKGDLKRLVKLYLKSGATGDALVGGEGERVSIQEVAHRIWELDAKIRVGDEVTGSNDICEITVVSRPVKGDSIFMIPIARLTNPTKSFEKDFYKERIEEPKRSQFSNDDKGKAEFDLAYAKYTTFRDLEEANLLREKPDGSFKIKKRIGQKLLIRKGQVRTAGGESKVVKSESLSETYLKDKFLKVKLKSAKDIAKMLL